MKSANLYSNLPKFTCVEGCSQCCGPVPLSTEEALLLGIPGKEMTTADENLDCEYLKDGKCSVYDRRPLLCRLFGIIPGMPCPAGGKPERMLSVKEEDRIINDYRKRFQ